MEVDGIRDQVQLDPVVEAQVTKIISEERGSVIKREISSEETASS